MYTIEKVEYGIRSRIEGNLSKKDLVKYLRERESFARSIEGEYSEFVDLRKIVPVSPQEKEMISAFLFKTNTNFLRLAVIVSSPVMISVGLQVTISSGLLEPTRFIDASKSANWEELGLEWVTNGVEPNVDAVKVTSQEK